MIPLRSAGYLVANLVLMASWVGGSASASDPVAVQIERTGVEPALELALPPGDPLARAEALRLLRTIGLLLIPESTNKRVMAFDPESGDLVDPDFLRSDPAHLSTPIEVIAGPDGRTLLLSDQVSDAVFEYDLSSGAFVRHFAPAGGVDPAILDNIRGIALRHGELLVCNADEPNEDAVARFDSAGNFFGNFIGEEGGGLESPFDVLEVTVGSGALAAGQWLVDGIESDAVHRYDATGAPLTDFAGVDGFPEQMVQIGNGHVLVANFSGTQQGVLELDASGGLVGIYNPVALGGPRGVHQLDDGHLLVTTGAGVHEIDRSGTLLATKISGVSGRFISRVGPWVPGVAVPAATARFDAEQYGRNLFVLGLPGPVDAAVDGSIWSFELARSRWSDTGLDLPVPISDSTLARLTDGDGAALYLFGGRDASGACTATVQVFHPDKEATAEIESDPWPGSVAGLTVMPGGVAVTGNRAYVWGGFCDSAPAPFSSSGTWIFDPLAPEEERWTSGPSLPFPAAYQAGAVVDGRVFSIGGATFDGVTLQPLATVLVLDPANLGAGWQTLASLPPATTGIAGTAGCEAARAFGFDTGSAWELAGRILLVGCGQGTGQAAESFVYDLDADSWSRFAANAGARKAQAGVFVVDSASTGRVWTGGGLLPSGLVTDAVDTLLVLSSLLQSDGFESGGLALWQGDTN